MKTSHPCTQGPPRLPHSHSPSLDLARLRRFHHLLIEEARQWAEHAEGLGLHVWTPSPGERTLPTVPGCFRRHGLWAHLFDQDFARLTRVAKWAGVRVIVVEREGTRQQHVDLCGAPLRKLLKQCPPCCRICGCTEEFGCYDEQLGSCWWLEPPQGPSMMGLCSHCRPGIRNQGSGAPPHRVPGTQYLLPPAASVSHVAARKPRRVAHEPDL